MTKYKQVPVAEVVSGYSGDPDTRGVKKLRVLDLSQCEIGDKLYSTTPDVQGEPISHDWDDQDKCRRCGDRDWYASTTCTPKSQTAPDVDVLVEALERARDAIGSLPEDSLGSVPDTAEYQGWYIRDELINDISTTLATHHKQGGEV